MKLFFQILKDFIYTFFDNFCYKVLSNLLFNDYFSFPQIFYIKLFYKLIF